MRKYVSDAELASIKEELRAEFENQVRLSVLYKQIEYIESDGSCYIDTGFIPNQDSRVVARFQHTANSTNEFLFGSRSSVSSNSFCFSNYTAGEYRTHYNNKYLDFSTTISTLYFLDKNKNVTTINNGAGVITHDYESFTCPAPLYLFCVNKNGTREDYAKCRLYEMQIYDNGTLVRDFVPVYHNIRMEYGLYDKLNDMFYPNAGSGTLTGA